MFLFFISVILSHLLVFLTAVCDPPCANGGRCLPNNFCECPQEFRGPQCNYRRSFQFQTQMQHCLDAPILHLFLMPCLSIQLSYVSLMETLYSCGELRPWANELQRWLQLLRRKCFVQLFTQLRCWWCFRVPTGSSVHLRVCKGSIRPRSYTPVHLW